MPRNWMPVSPSGTAFSWNCLLHLRRLVQLTTLLLFILMPYATSTGFSFLRGTPYSCTFFGLPLTEPLTVAQVLLSGEFPLWQSLAGAVLVLLITLCLGRVFCSWLCPFGLLSECVQRLCHWVTPARFLFRLDSFRSRALITGAGLVMVALLGAPLLQSFFLPDVLSLAFQSPFSGFAFLPVLVVLLGEGVYGTRVWCRWFCPQSVILSLVARLPAGLRLQRDPYRCLCAKHESACQCACPLGLEPRVALKPLECTQCGACVLACDRVHAGKPSALSFVWKGFPVRAEEK